MTGVEEPAGAGGRTRDAARTKAEILDVATQEFARAGYDGARVDEIAARPRATTRMIYYYFGGNKQHFAAVLKRAYSVIRQAEQEPDVDHLAPVAAVRRLAEVTFDHYAAHPDVIRLPGTETIHGARHIAAPQELGTIGSPALEVTVRILAAGRASGLFTADVDAVDLHALISSFCFSRVANRHTFGSLFGRDLLAADLRAHSRRMLGDMVIAYLTTDRTED